VAPTKVDVRKPGRIGYRCPNLTAMTGTAGTDGAAEGGQCQCGPCLERAEKPHVRVGRWIVRHSDLTKPPTPLIRWALLLILGLCCWAAGIPLVVHDWLGPIIIAGALILPDVAGFGIVGIRLDLKRTQDELNAVKLRVDMRQQVNNYYGALERATEAQTGEDAPKLRRVVAVRVDEAENRDVPL
jgi:hypothetical protein